MFPCMCCTMSFNMPVKKMLNATCLLDRIQVDKLICNRNFFILKSYFLMPFGCSWQQFLDKILVSYRERIRITNEIKTRKPFRNLHCSQVFILRNEKNI